MHRARILLQVSRPVRDGRASVFAAASAAAALCALRPVSAEVVLTYGDVSPADPEAAISTYAGTPKAVFATEAGVYTLDSGDKSIRSWSLARKNAEAFPIGLYDKDGITFKGDVGGVSKFVNPVAFAKHTSENKVAVLDAQSTAPTVRLYSFEETTEASGSGQLLSGVKWSLKAVCTNEAFSTGAAVAWAPDGRLAVVYGGVFSYIYGTDSSPFVGSYVQMLGADLSPDGEPARFPFKGEKTGASSGGVVSAIAFDSADSSFYACVAPSNSVYKWESVDDVAEGEPVRRFGQFGRYVTSDVSEDPLDPYANANFAGTSVNRLSGPVAIAVWHPDGAPDPVLVVVDRAKSIVAFFADTLFEPLAIGKERNSDYTTWDSFKNPEGVWVEEGGTRLIVADTGMTRIKSFDVDPAALVPDESAAIVFDAGESPVFPEDGYSDGAGAVTAAVHRIAVSVMPSVTNRTYRLKVSNVGSTGADAGAGVLHFAALVEADGSLADGSTADVTAGSREEIEVSVPWGETEAEAFVLALDGPSENEISLSGASNDAASAFSVENVPPFLVDAELENETGDIPAGTSPYVHAVFNDVMSDSVSLEWNAYSGESETAYFSFSESVSLGETSRVRMTAPSSPGDTRFTVSADDGDGGVGSKAYLVRYAEN